MFDDSDPNNQNSRKIKFLEKTTEWLKKESIRLTQKSSQQK